MDLGRVIETVEIEEVPIEEQGETVPEPEAPVPQEEEVTTSGL